MGSPVHDYVTDGRGNIYANADGTATLAYTVEKGKDSCPPALKQQIVPN